MVTVDDFNSVAAAIHGMLSAPFPPHQTWMEVFQRCLGKLTMLHTSAAPNFLLMRAGLEGWPTCPRSKPLPHELRETQSGVVAQGL